MAGLGLNAEAKQARDYVRGYFSEVESANRLFAQRMLPLIVDMIGGSADRLTPQTIDQVKPYLRIGFSIASDWLRENGFKSFDFPIDAVESATKTAALAAYPLPKDKGDIYAKYGFGPDDRTAVDSQINRLADYITLALQSGFAPERIVYFLLIDHVQPDDLQKKPSLLRQLLLKAAYKDSAPPRGDPLRGIRDVIENW